MTTGSFLTPTGLTVHAAPSIFANIGETKDITDVVTGWGHTVNAIGGYKSATANLGVSLADLDEWLDTGLGRDITLHTADLNIRFNGFVNNLIATIGGLNITIGPLMQIANRAKCVYSTVDTSISPPAVGVRAVTSLYNSTASQAIYCTLAKVLSIGGSTLANAQQIAQSYIAEYDIPQVSQSLSLGGGGGISLKLDCLGYGAFLETYPYINTSSGTTTISARLPLILAANPSGIYSTDYSEIASNTTTIPIYENNDRTAWTQIASLIDKGDASFNRYIFGIYAARRAFYNAVPSAIEYYHQVTSEYPEVTDVQNARVNAWDILPGKWLQVNDILVGRVNPSSLSADPRNIFIESVSYTAPYGLSITGGKVSRLAQYLGRLGLAGVSAK